MDTKYLHRFLWLLTLLFCITISFDSNATPNLIKEYSSLEAGYNIANEAPRPWFDDLPDNEDELERKLRLKIIVDAAFIVSWLHYEGWKWGQKELFALLLATSYEEGWRWHVSVHSGKKRGDKGRAACLNQIWRHHKMFPKETWKRSMGTDLESTIICMDGAAKWFAHYSSTCISKWHLKHDIVLAYTRIITGYGTGRTCSGTPKWALNRAYRAKTWLKELQ